MDLESLTITPAVVVLDQKGDLEVVVEGGLVGAAGGLEISRTVTTMEVEVDLVEGRQVEDLEEDPQVVDLEPKRRADLGAGDLDQRTMANLLDLGEVRIEQCGISIPRCGNLLSLINCFDEMEGTG